MNKLFQSYDNRILKSKPIVWITAMHWLLPLALVLCLLSYVYGWFLPYSNSLTNEYVGDFIFPAAWITSICLLILVVTFFIREVRFDAIRVHHSLPYKRPFTHFIIFFITLFSITAIPHMVSLGTLHKCRYAVDEAVVKSDLTLIDSASVHFISKPKYKSMSGDSYDPIPSWVKDKSYSSSNEYTNATYRSFQVPSYVLHGDSVFVIRNGYDAYRFLGNHVISLDQAKNEIESFKRTASKYTATFNAFTTEEQIQYRHDYSNSSDNQYESYVGLTNNYDFGRVYRFHQSILDGDRLFYASKLKFWKVYTLLPFFLAMLLFILVSTKLADFGWALLVGSLTAVFAGMMTGLFGVLTGFDGHNAFEWFWLIFITLLILVYVLVIHRLQIRSSIKRAFAIALHIFTPMITWVYWMLGDELHECPYGSIESESHREIMNTTDYSNLGILVVVLVCVLSIYLFNKYYTNQYVYPKK